MIGNAQEVRRLQKWAETQTGQQDLGREPGHNPHTQRSRSLPVCNCAAPPCGKGAKPRGRARIGLSPFGSRPRWLHGATSYAPASYILAPMPGAIMDLVVKARDPKDGATVMVICPSGREALAMLEHLRQERLKIIGITDRQGAVVSESHLATDPWSLRLFRAVPRFQPRGGKG